MKSFGNQTSLAFLFLFSLCLFSASIRAEDVVQESGEAKEQVTAPVDFKSIAEKNREAIVSVAFLGREGEELGMGTGFVVDDTGLIATNRHVIGEARPIRVTFLDGQQYTVESIYASDETSDLALLKLNSEELTNRKIVALKLGNRAEQGDDVAAIGHPRGYKNSLVTGIVSGTQEINGIDLIQVSMPIDHGNSGGPLLNRAGEVVGIITYKSAEAVNVGFAMPVEGLKSILESPNPITLSRWTTIGRLNSEKWQELFGAAWSQRAGQILVSGSGKGFGGRSLCLWHEAPLDNQKFELQVSVKLDDEAGAAGLVFQADRQDRHYGFYPSAGNLRLSRFDGADVFSWHVLQEISSPAYKPGDWNRLKVSIDQSHIRCYCNDELVIDLEDHPVGKKSNAVGLAKFRDTKASFRGFELAEELSNSQLTEDIQNQLDLLVEELKTEELISQQSIQKLQTFPLESRDYLNQMAADLELRAAEIRRLNRRVHDSIIRLQIEEELKRKQPRIAQLALFLARYDNPELDVETYLMQIDELADEIKNMAVDQKLNEVELREVMDRYLFEENGFHGSRTNYYHKSNSYLNEVIDDREGLPISLSVLYLALAEKLELDIRGIGLPGHFIVRQYVNDEPDMMVDVFDRGRILGLVDVMTRVELQSNTAWNDAYLEPQSSRDILIRMIRNLQGIAERQESVEDLLRYLNLLVAIDPANQIEHRYIRSLVAIRQRERSLAEEDLTWLEDHGRPVLNDRQLNELTRFAEQWLGLKDLKKTSQEQNSQ